MENYEIYQDIQSRTNGDIYIGVVGPVRVGKSTFISQFMQKFVVPNIESENVKQRTIDELPQSAEGKTIMTTQPNFVPNESVKIKIANAEMKVRMIDCVGYVVSGVMGHTEEDKPRLVKTPWTSEDIPFEQAAQIGTDKVINDHSTIGFVVTTDGSVAGIARANYIDAEEKVVRQMKVSGKPFVMVLNCKNPNSAENKKLTLALKEKYSVPVVAVNALEMKEEDVDKIMKSALMEFPVSSIKIEMPSWLSALEFESDIISDVAREMKRLGSEINKLSDVDKSQIAFAESVFFEPIAISSINAGNGTIRFSIIPKQDLFYKVLSNECGYEICDDFALISYIKALAVAKVEYDKIKNALEQVKSTGYGIVEPSRDDLELGTPEIIKQGGRYGVKIKASAPSLHIMKVDVETEVTPIVGNEEQSQDLANNLVEQFQQDPNSIWETNILGKSLYSLVGDSINSKIVLMPLEAQKKMRKTLGRIVNEGKGGVLCILL
ncbi:MAG: stage IV sporulation protein A [Clostridiales bacterium]|nr:stage IV sporulation protein A [Clostridiales bacterium]